MYVYRNRDPLLNNRAYITLSKARVIVEKNLRHRNWIKILSLE